MLTEQSLLTFKELQLHGGDSLHSDDDDDDEEDFGARRDCVAVVNVSEVKSM